MYYFLAKLWSVVSMVLIVLEETSGGGPGHGGHLIFVGWLIALSLLF